MTVDDLIKHKAELGNNLKDTETNLGILTQYAPSIAKNIAVAASLVASMNMMGSVDLPFIKLLTETELTTCQIRESRERLRGPEVNG